MPQLWLIDIATKEIGNKDWTETSTITGVSPVTIPSNAIEIKAVTKIYGLN